MSTLLLGATACGGGTSAEPAPAATVGHPATSAVAGSLDDAALGDPFLGPLQLSVPSDCSVPVFETVEKAGTSAELTYRLTFTTSAGATNVTWEDMRVQAVNGQPVPAEAMDSAAAVFRLPSLRVDNEGHVIEVQGMSELIDAFGTVAPDYATFLRSNPALVTAIEEAVVSKYWNAWFERWADWGSFAQPVEEGRFGEDLNRIEMTSVGTTADGLVALRSTIALTGEQFAAAVNEIVGGGSGVVQQDTYGEAIETVEVVTDPLTLRPNSVFYDRTVEVRADAGTQSASEQRLSVLDWADSTCE